MPPGSVSSDTLVMPLSTQEAVVNLKALSLATKQVEKEMVQAQKVIREHELGIKNYSSIIELVTAKYDANLGSLKKLSGERMSAITSINAEIEAKRRLAEIERGHPMLPKGELAKHDDYELEKTGYRLAYQEMSQAEIGSTQNLREQFKERMRLRHQENAEVAKSAVSMQTVEFRQAADKAEIANLTDKEQRMGRLNLRYSETAIRIEENRQARAALTRDEILSNDEKSKAMALLARESNVLNNRARQLERMGATTEGVANRSRMMFQNATYAMQDFVSAGGLAGGHNALSQGFRGAANNLEMMAMAASSAMTPMKAMAIGLIPTAVLGVMNYVDSLAKADESQKKAAESAKEYHQALMKITEANQAVTQSESQRREIKNREMYMDARKVAVNQLQESINKKEELMEEFNAVKKAADEGDITAKAALPLVEMKNRTAIREAIQNVKKGRRNLAALDQEEEHRKVRESAEQAISKAGGAKEVVKRAATFMSKGGSPDLARAMIVKSMSNLGPEVADMVGDTMMEEAKAEAGRMRREYRDPLAQAKRRVEDLRVKGQELRDSHAGGYAIDKNQMSMHQAEAMVQAIERSRESMFGALSELATILKDVRDNTAGGDVAPQNNVVRNGLNALANPLATIMSGVGY